MANRFGTLAFGLFLGFLLAFTAIHLINEEITPQVIQEASKIIGIEFTEAERDSMISDLEDNRASYKEIRKLELNNDVPPVLNFNPIPPGRTFDKNQRPTNWNIPDDISLPENRADLAFYSIKELASLIHNCDGRVGTKAGRKNGS